MDGWTRKPDGWIMRNNVDDIGRITRIYEKLNIGKGIKKTTDKIRGGGSTRGQWRVRVYLLLKV